ncbi:MAG: carbamoyl-phosphate synthase (glutamine-hydrolyzing) large subunit [Pseudomonadota bacterium]
MRKSFKKVLILGSGAIRIGQAGEFDYSGSQAMKALKEEKIRTIVINPNIATIQTSDYLADKIYFLPIDADFVEQVIKKEKPDGIMLMFGGQTALNVGMELWDKGTLKKYGVEVLGTPVDAIRNTEDRELFSRELKKGDFKVPASRTASNVDEALKAAEHVRYPVMCRIAFALGGLGSGVARSESELRKIAAKAFSHTHQILIEEYLDGWKEVEYEVVRDRHNNCIVICSMENLDPMGIHTGESIVVAPVQTLTAAENFKLRSESIRLVRHLGVIGECNVQFALSPDSADHRIIEVNARLSRSSALASKATGYPLAFVAAKLGLGIGLTEIRNSITKETSACFEPALDYIVIKYPRWDLQKFHMVEQILGSEMKSVGEVMAIARGFEEALQKAVRMLDVGMNGIVGNELKTGNLENELRQPTDKRMFAIAEALKAGFSIEKIRGLTKIDPWFLYKLKNIVEAGVELEGRSLKKLPDGVLRRAKEMGFSDKQIAILTGSTEPEVRKKRIDAGIVPYEKQIDTMAAEYPAKTNYLYMTYNAGEHDLKQKVKRQVIVLGGGPYRIGSSVEFDWCCVNCLNALRRTGLRTIMINCNPETVSTDYDVSDKLYFEELTLERVLDICEKEQPKGVIVSMGGQIPNTLALPLHRCGVKILGTSPVDIDRAEDRHKFSSLLDDLVVDQPAWEEVTSLKAARKFARSVGYPVLIRPSYVLSGAAMSIVLSARELNECLVKASEVSREHPVVLTKFIEGAKEIEIDAIGKRGELYCYAISEHVENAGVHSGDATIVLPPQRTYLETMRRVKTTTKQIAKSLNITGPFNIQYLAKDNDIMVIECNLRASRSFPFVSKVYRINFIDLATKVIVGRKVPRIDRSSFDLDYVGVKAPQFSFTRLKGSDPVLGVEMVSTGEVACLGDDFNEAFIKSLISVGFRIPKKNILLSTGPIQYKAEFLNHAKILSDMGFSLYATGGTASFLESNGIKSKVLYWPLEKKEPNTISYITGKKIDLVINIPKNIEKEELDNDHIIRRTAVDFDVPLITNIQIARRFVEAISRLRPGDLKPKSLDEYR